MASGKGLPPDAAVVGGVTQVSADVLEHFLGRGTASGVEDLHTAPQTTPTKISENSGLRDDQKLNHEGSEGVPQAPGGQTPSREVLSHLCIDTSHLRAAQSSLSPALLGEPKHPHLEDPIKTQIPRKPDSNHHESRFPPSFSTR